MLNESELSHLNAANTKIMLLISYAFFTFPCWFAKVGSTIITRNGPVSPYLPCLLSFIGIIYVKIYF